MSEQSTDERVETVARGMRQVEAAARALASVASGGVVGPDAPDLAWQDWTTEAAAVIAALDDESDTAELARRYSRVLANLNAARAERDALATGVVRAKAQAWEEGLVAAKLATLGVSPGARNPYRAARDAGTTT